MAMRLMTKEIERKFEKKFPIGSQDGKGKEAEVVVKFFGGSSYTFLVTEGNKLDNGDYELFGMATFGYGWEWGYACLSDLERMRFPPFGLPIERDMYLATGTKIKDLVNDI